MQLPKFMFSEKLEGPNQFVTCTLPPFAVFEIATYTNPEKWEQKIKDEKRLSRPVKGWQILVIFKTALDKESVQEKGLAIFSQLKELVDHVMPERIESRKNGYRKRIKIDYRSTAHYLMQGEVNDKPISK